MWCVNDLQTTAFSFNVPQNFIFCNSFTSILYNVSVVIRLCLIVDPEPEKQVLRGEKETTQTGAYPLKLTHY